MAWLAVAAHVLMGCGSSGSFASGGDGPCSVSMGFMVFEAAPNFDAAAAGVERHMGADFPAPEPPDWATGFSVAQGTLIELVEDDAGHTRNTESPYRYAWLRYGIDDEDPPEVMVGVREIPYCDSQMIVFDERTIRTSDGNRRVAVMEVDDGVQSASAMVILEPHKPWTTVKLSWPIETPKDQRDDDIESWVAAVIEAMD